jgi:hypothetical protein
VTVGLSCLPSLPADAPPVPAVEAGADAAAACGDGYIDLAAGEECDPGPGLLAGSAVCSTNCKVICAGLRWPLNDHCYELQGSAKDLKTTAVAACDDQNGSHVATFASVGELTAAVVYAHANIALATNDFWVGLVDSFSRYSSVVPNEPGWSPECSGCYAKTDVPTAPLHLPKDVEAGAGCVMATFLAGDPPTLLPWNQYPCDSPVDVHVLCEREPVGSYSQPCGNGGYCMDLVFTAATNKHYVFFSSGLPAAQAEAQCALLTERDAGRVASLVVLESRDEREQLWHELSQLNPTSGSIWIGLATNDAGLWTWDDGTPSDGGYPSPWAVNQPASPLGQAFMEYDPYDFSVDNTLAKSASPDGGTESNLPYVCQVRVTDAGPDSGPDALE